MWFNQGNLKNRLLKNFTKTFHVATVWCVALQHIKKNTSSVQTTPTDGQLKHLKNASQHRRANLPICDICGWTRPASAGIQFVLLKPAACQAWENTIILMDRFHQVATHVGEDCDAANPNYPGLTDAEGNHIGNPEAAEQCFATLMNFGSTAINMSFANTRHFVYFMVETLNELRTNKLYEAGRGFGLSLILHFRVFSGWPKSNITWSQNEPDVSSEHLKNFYWDFFW